MNLEQFIGSLVGRAAQGIRPNDPLTRAYAQLMARFGEHALSQWSAISATGMVCNIVVTHDGRRRPCRALASGPCIHCGKLVCLMHSMASVDDGSLLCKACVQHHIGASTAGAAGPGSNAEAEPNDPREEEVLRRQYLLLLGLDEEADVDDVKRRFKELMAQYHPDRNGHLPPDERERFEAKVKAFSQAYHWLVEHERRAA